MAISRQTPMIVCSGDELRENVVAIAAMLLAWKPAFKPIAPTQILAEQHYAVLGRARPLGSNSRFAPPTARKAPYATFDGPRSENPAPHILSAPPLLYGVCFENLGSWASTAASSAFTAGRLRPQPLRTSSS